MNMRALDQPPLFPSSINLRDSEDSRGLPVASKMEGWQILHRAGTVRPKTDTGPGWTYAACRPPQRHRLSPPFSFSFFYIFFPSWDVVSVIFLALAPQPCKIHNSRQPWLRCKIYRMTSYSPSRSISTSQTYVPCNSCVIFGFISPQHISEALPCRP
jgi:hypothetical protein